MTSKKYKNLSSVRAFRCALRSEEFLTTDCTECTDLKKALPRGFWNLSGSGWREDS